MGPLKPLKPKYTYKKGRGQLTPKVPLDVFNEEVLGRREVPEQATSFSGRGSIFFLGKMVSPLKMQGPSQKSQQYLPHEWQGLPLALLPPSSRSSVSSFIPQTLMELLIWERLCSASDK